jgi:hypothetical protein
MDPDQPAHPHSLIRIHAVRLQTLLQVENLIANSLDPDQTARMRRLVWIHACRKRTMLVLSWRGYMFDEYISKRISSDLNNMYNDMYWDSLTFLNHCYLKYNKELILNIRIDEVLYSFYIDI